MQVSMSLSYLSPITSHFLNVLHWMVFDLIFYRVTVNCNALFNQISTHCRTLPTHSKIILQRVSNGLKNIVTHFQCIFCHAFSTYLLCRVFANYKWGHIWTINASHGNGYRRLVSLKIQQNIDLLQCATLKSVDFRYKKR